VKPRGGTLFTGMFLAAALSPLGSTMIAVALPSISSELGVPGGALTQWLVASYLIAGIAAMGPCGKLGDVIGHRRGLMIGMSVYAAGSALGFLVATLPALALARITMAVGGALVVPSTMALLRNAVPEARRPRAFGMFGAVMGTAAAVGPLLGGELTAHFGWRAVFVANLPVILVAFALIRLAGPVAIPDPVERRPRFDIEGSVLLAAALTVIVAASRMHGAGVPWIALVGVVLFAAFVVWERRAAAPVVDLRMFARRAFAAGNAVVGLQNLAMYALLFQLPIFFEQVRGIHSGSTGRALIGMMIAMVVLAPVGGRLSERFGARPIAFLGCFVSLVGMFVIADFSKLAVPADALLGLILIGAGLGLATSPSQSAAMSAVHRSQAGMAGGALSTSRYLGGVLGISVLGALLASNPGVVSHHTAAVCYMAALALAAIAALMLPGKLRLEPEGFAPTALD
jgi:EmrB/QacA subfamily drug resistance transporter